ncbi:hypothetical protein P171DRAFT_434119 [Karstenula rhodostoma CBS 690.94]|uniref:NACHT domain-containing protein n=1 Tax=Karstenula rhodostoma CBS 690.94 TaxID=1392251 RepID=A0A9P4PDL1_9PLEO|nr:hypothetical protein P171DRAFT_434119 [Karstenula rhodostoma CBS 690.94]
MKVAFDDLERTIIPADAREMRATTTIDQVRQASLRIEDQLAARQSLRNMRRLVPLLQGLEHYSRVVEVLCNGTPFLSWVWAPIILILRVASEFVEAFEHIMKGYAKIAESLGRFEILSDAFATNADFQQSIASYYADILQFHQQAYLFVRRSCWKILFITSWGRFERRFNHILDDLDRHGALIDKQANALNIVESRQMRATIQQWKEKSMTSMEADEKYQQTKDFEAVLAWLKVDGSEQITLLDSVSVDKAAYPGTCDWLLQHGTIKAWLRQTPETPLLWLYGNPGTGKSAISAELVNWLQCSNATVVYHFCAYTYTSSTQYEGIIRSLLVQILRNDRDLVNHVYQEYVLKRKPAKISTLDKLLHTAVLARSHESRQQQYLWILVDALNECESSKQQQLANLLHRLSNLSTNQTIIKVLITTRKLPVMTKRLRKNQVLSLSEEEGSLTSAIRIYASCRLKSMESRLRQIELETEEIDVIETLVAEKAHGMFLYARLVLDYISSNVFYDGDELKASIHRLPQTLAEFYNNLLMQILKNLDDRSQSRVQTVFNWIAFTKRPLRKLELLSALSLSDGNSEVNKIAPSYILDDTCSPLLSQRHDTTFGFIHATVKDYLQSSMSPLTISESNATRQHCIASISCLLSGLRTFAADYDPQERLLRLVRGLHAFHVYATENWTDYLLACFTDNPDPQSPIFGLAMRLASTLERNTPAPSTINQSDDQFGCLFPHPLLLKHVSWALLARSQTRLDQDIMGSSEAFTEPVTLDGISMMLIQYQAAVENILELESLPGASCGELDRSKSQFRSSAYTCRLHSCPRATVGFENAVSRDKHELNHTSGFRCPVTGCQFPPYRTAKALKTHTKKEHTPQLDWRLIRRQKKHAFQSSSPAPALPDQDDWPQKRTASTTLATNTRKQLRTPETSLIGSPIDLGVLNWDFYDGIKPIDALQGCTDMGRYCVSLHATLLNCWY